MPVVDSTPDGMDIERFNPLSNFRTEDKDF